MGNSSSSKYVTLQVATNSLSAGSDLSGSILVSIPENSASSIDLLTGASLLFICKEDTKVEYTTTSTDSNGHSHTQRHHAYSKRDLLRVAIPLTVRSNGTSVKAGSYKIPFQYTLPDDLPSSFYHASHGGYCSIRYKLKLQFRGNGSKELPLDITSKPYLGPPLSHLVQPVTSPVSLCCCIPRGFITLAANGKTSIHISYSVVDSWLMCFSNLFVCETATILTVTAIVCFLSEQYSNSTRTAGDCRFGSQK